MNKKLDLDLHPTTKMSMPVITLSPPSKTGIPHPPEIIKNSREASFSSYLDGAEKAFVIKLGAASTPSVPASHDHIFRAKNRTDDDKEIDVFGAEKYFNDALNHSPKLSTKISLSSQDDPTQMLAVKEQPAISIHSESSWNSRSSLLRSVPRNQQLGRANRRSFLASIGCNCTCADKNSVDIDDDYIPRNRSRQGDQANDQMRVASAAKIISSSPKNYFNMEKKLAMVSWDAIAPSVAEELKIPPISSEMHNDSDSDASSDLFEIESLYKDGRFDPRQASDAPSEASIEWSVVTASAADFSVLSDSDEIASTKKSRGNTKSTGSFKEMPRIRPTLLSGCKSHKAVSVAGDAHTRPMTRFHDETKLSFDAKATQPRSAPAAHILFT